MGLVDEASMAVGAVALGLRVAGPVTAPEAAAVAVTEVWVTSAAGSSGEGGVAGTACVGGPLDCAS